MHHRCTLGAVEHDQLEQVARPISSEDQITNRVLGNLFDEQCVS